MATHAYDFSATNRSFPGSALSTEVADRLLELETMLFDPAVRRDMTTVGELLTDDFREFGGSGRVYSKLDIIAELGTEQPSRITLSDFHCELLAPTVALVTYKSLALHHGVVGSHALRSSLWVFTTPERKYGQTAPRENTWRMQFHQGTRF